MSQYSLYPPKNGGGGGGTVNSVTASSPLSSSGGTDPNISITMASTSTNGFLDSTDWNTFNNKQAGPLTGDVTTPSSTSTVTSIMATSNSTLVTLSALSLPYSQLTGTPTPGANTALSNLSAVAINTALLPGVDGTIDLGSITTGFRSAFLRNAKDTGGVISVDFSNRSLDDTTGNQVFGFATTLTAQLLNGSKLSFDGSTSGAVSIVAPSIVTAYSLTLPSAQGGASTFLQNNGAGLLSWVAGNAGTVTSVSVTSTNGFAGTVATATTVPAITISTTITGIIKGNGTAISAATPGTDYVIPSGSITGTASNITATSNSTLTTLSALSLPYSQLTGTPPFLPPPLEALPLYTSNYFGDPGTFIGNASDSDQANETIYLGSTDTAIAANSTSAVLLIAGDLTNASSTGQAGYVYVQAGNAVSGNGQPGTVYINGGNADALSGGNVQISSGASNGADGGNVTIIGSTGSLINGSINLQVSGATGKIQLQDASVGTAGQVWTSTDTFGSGHWAAAAGGTKYAWSGYHDASYVWEDTSPSGSFQNIPNTSIGTFTQRVNVNFGTVTTAASNNPGITFTPAASGITYIISVIPQAYPAGPNKNVAFRIWDGTTEIQRLGTTDVGSTAQSNNPVTFEGLYTSVSTSPVTITIQSSGASSSDPIINAAATGLTDTSYAIEWTIHAI